MLPNTWVRLVNNATSVAYVSTAASNINGMFPMGVIPAGTYTVSTGPTATGPWTPTGDNNYNVPMQLGIFNVKDYGAKGDGITDDSVAILATVNAAAALVGGENKVSRGSVYFPAGIYIITSNAVLTPTNNIALPGILFQGAGWNTSVLRYGSISVDTWFYDNSPSDRNTFSVFCDLGFEGMDFVNYTGYASLNSHAKGFRFTTGSNEQGFRFFRCRFDMLDVNFDMEGTNLASEMKFHGCRFYRTRSTVYYINNGQSFNHEFFGCDIEQIYGDFFELGPNSGGAIKAYGGSWIPFGGKSGTVDTYILRATATGSVGQISWPTLLVSGVRFEMSGNYSNILNIANVLQASVNFENCNFVDHATSPKTNYCTIGAYAKVTFRDCDFYDFGGSTSSFNLNSAGGYGLNGSYDFVHCGTPIDFSDRIIFMQTGGSARAIDCYPTRVGAQSDGTHWAMDFDLHFAPTGAGGQASSGTWPGNGSSLTGNAGANDVQFRLKTAQIKQHVDYWPGGGPGASTLKLPINAIIKGIHIRKGPFGSDGTICTLNVSRLDQTGSPHLTTNSDQWKNTLTGDLDNYFYCVGTTTNERTLALYNSAAPGQAQQGGIVIVEYY